MTVLPFELPEQPTLDLPDAPPAVAGAPVIAYESEWATVYHGRAEHVLPMIRTESVDLVVTDPPYGVDWQSGRRAEKFDKIDGDKPTDRADVAKVMEQLVRVVGQHRHLYVFGPADVLAGLKVSEVVELVWDKVALGSGDVTSTWSPNHERINFTVSKHRHAGKAGAGTVPTRMRSGSVLRYTRPTGKAVRHPSEKPVPLLRELIESSSRPGETVLDAYGGVLSTAVAAVLAGRRTVIIEQSEKYVDLGIERIRKAERVAADMEGI